MQIVKQSHDTKGFVVLPRRWVGRHVAQRLNIDDDRQGDLVRRGGEHRAASYTRSTHTGIGKPGSVEAISAMGNSERTSPWARKSTNALSLGERCRLDGHRTRRV